MAGAVAVAAVFAASLIEDDGQPVAPAVVPAAPVVPVAVPATTTPIPVPPTRTTTRKPARVTPRTTRSKPRTPVTTTREVPNSERTDIASCDMMANGRVYCEGPGAEETMSRYNG
jgi:hypothetical protein